MTNSPRRAVASIAESCTPTNVCLFHPGHQLAEKDLVTPEDLQREPIIDMEPQYNTHQMDINALRYMGAEPDIAVEVDANGHEAGFIAAGVGISMTNSMLPRSACSSVFNRGLSSQVRSITTSSSGRRADN